MSRTLLTATVLMLVSLAFVASPVAAAAEGAADVEKAVKAAHQQWNDLMVKGDATALQAFLADGYVLTDPGGRIREKAELVAGLKEKAFKLDKIESTDVQVHVHGDAAVVTCRDAIKGEHEGQPVDGRFAVTAVYVKRNGTWQAAGAHLTPVGQE